MKVVRMLIIAGSASSSLSLTGHENQATSSLVSLSDSDLTPGQRSTDVSSIDIHQASDLSNHHFLLHRRSTSFPRSLQDLERYASELGESYEKLARKGSKGNIDNMARSISLTFDYHDFLVKLARAAESARLTEDQLTDVISQYEDHIKSVNRRFRLSRVSVVPPPNSVEWKTWKLATGIRNLHAAGGAGISNLLAKTPKG